MSGKCREIEMLPEREAIRARHEFKIEQGGIVVAGATSSNLKSLLREACHYLFMYGQDGPTKITGSDKFMQEFRKIKNSENFT